MIEVEERPLRAFEEDRAAFVHPVVQEQRRVGDVGGEPLPLSEGLVRDRFRLPQILTALLQPAPRLAFDDAPDLLDERRAIGQIADADPDPRRLGFVGRADPPLRRADPRGVSRRRLAHRIQAFQQRKDDVCAVADEQTVVENDASGQEVVDLFQELREIEHRPVSDHDARLGTEDARRDVLQRVPPAGDRDRVPGVRPALIARDDVEAVGEEVDDLPLPFVAPLRADDGEVRPHAGQPAFPNRPATRKASDSSSWALSRNPCAPSWCRNSRMLSL